DGHHAKELPVNEEDLQQPDQRDDGIHDTEDQPVPADVSSARVVDGRQRDHSGQNVDDVVQRVDGEDAQQQSGAGIPRGDARNEAEDADRQKDDAEVEQ